LSTKKFIGDKDGDKGSNNLELVSDVTYATDIELVDHVKQDPPALKLRNTEGKALTLDDAGKPLSFQKDEDLGVQAVFVRAIDNGAIVLGHYEECVIYDGTNFIRGSCNDSRLMDSMFDLYYEKEDLPEFMVMVRENLPELCPNSKEKRKPVNRNLKPFDSYKNPKGIVYVDLNTREIVYTGSTSMANAGLRIQHFRRKRVLDDKEDNTGLIKHKISSKPDKELVLPKKYKRRVLLTSEEEKEEQPKSKKKKAHGKDPKGTEKGGHGDNDKEKGNGNGHGAGHGKNGKDGNGHGKDGNGAGHGNGNGNGHGNGHGKDGNGNGHGAGHGKDGNGNGHGKDGNGNGNGHGKDGNGHGKKGKNSRKAQDDDNDNGHSKKKKKHAEADSKDKNGKNEPPGNEDQPCENHDYNEDVNGGPEDAGPSKPPCNKKRGDNNYKPA